MGIISKYKQSNSKREIKDVFYLMALQGLNYIAPLLVLPYLMKVLGAEKFGYIGFSLAVCQYLMLIVDFGFNLSATKRIAINKENHNRLNEIFSATIYSKILLLFISFIILLTIAAIPQFAIYKETMFLMFLMVVGNAFLWVFLFQGMGNIRIVSVVNTIAKLSILPLTFILVKSSDDYLLAALIQSAVSVFAAIISIAIIIRKKWVKLTSVCIKNCKEEIKESWPIFLSSAATSIYMALFVIALGYFCQADDVGRYSAADKIVRASIWIVVAPVIQSFYPKICELSQIDKAKAIRTAKIIIAVILVPMIAECLCFLFMPNYITDLLGEDYANTQSIFMIMSVIPIFSGLSLSTSQLVVLAVHDKKKEYQRICIFAGIIAIIGIFIAIPQMHAIGAAIVLDIIELFICALMLYHSNIFNINKATKCQ